MTYNSSITDWSNTTDYNLRLQQYMKAVEGEVLPAYVDNVGVPTIGWGFAISGAHANSTFVDYFIQQYLKVNNPDLQNPNTPLLAHLSSAAVTAETNFYNNLVNTLDRQWPADGTSNQSGSSVDLQNALNKILNDRITLMHASNSPYSANDLLLIGAPSSTFQFNSTTDVANAFMNQVQPSYEATLDRISLGVPQSDERIALFSLLYQGEMNSQFQGKLKNALSLPDANDARAQTWYTIRYLRPYSQTGDAWRNFTEASMFGLYNDNSPVSSDESFSIYRMFTKHRDDMLAFDSKHVADLTKANAILENVPGVGAQPIGDALLKAANVLVARYSQYIEAPVRGGNNTIFTTDIQVTSADKAEINAQNSTDADLLIATDQQANTINAGGGNDVLIGGTGNDKLYGLGGNDVLVAGGGTDLLDGGAGKNDYYIYTSQPGTAEIKDDTGQGAVLLDNTQIKGTTNKLTSSSGGVMQWNDGSTTYKFKPDLLCSAPGLGTMTITTGNDTITIDNFDLRAALTNGYLGIKLPNQTFIAADTGTSLPDGSDKTTEVAHGNTKTVTIYALAGNTVQLNCDGSGTYEYCTGADIFSFDGGKATLTIPDGQDSITVTLIDTSNTSSADTATLTASLTDANGTITSNNLNITFDDPNPNADTTYTTIQDTASTNLFINGNSPSGTPGSVAQANISFGNYNGGTPSLDTYGWSSDRTSFAVDCPQDSAPAALYTDEISADKYANDQINVTVEQSLVMLQNGDNLVIGNDHKSIIDAGNGDNQIYAGAQISLDTALANQKDADATGTQGDFIAVGNGNSTIIGGNGNDLIDTGTGDNVIVCGAGENSLCGGVESYGIAFNWSMNDDTTKGYFDIVNFAFSTASGTFTAPANYHGNADTYGNPFGIGEGEAANDLKWRIAA